MSLLAAVAAALLLPAASAHAADAFLTFNARTDAVSSSTRPAADAPGGLSRLKLDYGPEASGAIPLTIPETASLFQDPDVEEPRFPRYELVSPATGLLRTDGSRPLLSIDARVRIQRTKDGEPQLYDVVIVAERSAPGADLEVRFTAWESGADPSVDRPSFWGVFPGELVAP